MSNANPHRSGRSFIFSVAVLAVIWSFLTGGTLISWTVGIPVIILALTAARLLPAMPSFRINPVVIIPFCFFFIRQSFSGGIDVASRAILPGCRVSPCFITYEFRMSNAIARMYFANVVSLLPGTLSADLQDTAVLIHLLDERLPNLKNLRMLEEKVAVLFGERIDNG